MHPRIRRLPSMLFGLLVLWADRGLTQCGTTPSLRIDPSTRSRGMGGASSAVFWGGDPSGWANPALLGYRSGFRYEYSKYQLVPDLASDVFFRSTRITFGGWGVGLSFAGQPNLLGGSRLDYGTSDLIDSGGNVIGTFDSYETVESFGLGVNLVQVLESILGATSTTSNLGRWGEASLGWARKRVLADLAPGVPGVTIQAATAETNDLGFAVRVRPIDTVAFESPGPELAPMGGLQLDVTFAMSWLNHDDAALDFGAGQIPDPIARDRRMGVAIHAATGFPPAWRQPFETSHLSWLLSGLTPLLSGGVTWESSKTSLPGEPERLECTQEDLYGAELIVANVLSLRWGYVHAPDSEVNEATWGLGLGFSLGGFLGVRYDHASSPEAAGLADFRCESVSAYVDCLALVDTVRGSASD